MFVPSFFLLLINPAPEKCKLCIYESIASIAFMNVAKIWMHFVIAANLYHAAQPFFAFMSSGQCAELQ